MIPILDNGHGGVINGVYQTPGKRSPNWDQGVLYEGDFNRAIVNGITSKLSNMCKPYYHACTELNDISLGERVRRANDYYKKSGNDAYLLSIHANAGGGNGWEVFTSPGQTESDEIAEQFALDFRDNFPHHPGRFNMGDGDLDKEAKFFVLTETIGPAVLFEVGFMDNKIDYKKLWDEAFRTRVIDSLVESILKLY